MKYLLIVLLLIAPAAFGQRLNPNSSLQYALIGWWTMNGGVADFSGLAGGGFLEGSATWPSGMVGASLGCNGADLSVRLPTGILAYFTGGKFSFFAWINETNQTSGNTIIKNWGDSIAGMIHFDTQANSNKRLSLYVSQSDGTVIGPLTGASDLSISTWYHVGIVANGSTIQMYLNGAATGSPGSYNGTLKTSFTNIRLGAKPDDGTGVSGSTPLFFNGRMDDVRFYNRALSFAEVLALYGGGYGAQ